mgnify:CR=1 FL=1|jgi:hypothetical protein
MTRGAVDQGPDQEVDTFLLGDRAIATFEENQSQYGCDYTRVVPAWVEGKRAFIVQRSWSPAPGYSSEGDEDVIISFEEGVKLLLEKGIYDALVPKA